MSRLRALACLAAAAGGAAFVPPPPSLLPLGPAEAVRVVAAAASPGSPEDGDGGGGGAGDGGGGPAGNWLANLRDEADRNASGGNLPGDGDDDDGYGDGGGPEGEEEPGNVNIPSTGVSVGDALVDAQLDEYRTALEEVTGLPGVAAVRTEVLLGRNVRRADGEQRLPVAHPGLRRLKLLKAASHLPKCGKCSCRQICKTQ